jgi:hypothetical protein
VDTPWTALGAAAWAVLFAALVCWWLLLPAAEGPGIGVSPALRLALALLVVCGTTGASIVVVRATWAPAAPFGADPGAVATLRTAVLSAAALVVAWLGRRVRTRDFGALLYPLLAAGGIKVILEDLRASPPLLLFVALALYGGALIVGPRLAKGRV